jgi:hypothetical protein
MKEVFISYAWSGDSEAIANDLEKACQTAGIQLVRDKTDLGFRGLIKQFMQEIGRGKCVIAVISDKYLRSKNCMYELLEISKNGDFLDRIFPIVLEDARIYDALERLEYIKYWDGKIAALKEGIKEVDPINLQGITDEINLYVEIRNRIAGLVDSLQNMNALTADIHRQSNFNALMTAIAQRLEQDADLSRDSNNNLSNMTIEREKFDRGERKTMNKRSPKIILFLAANPLATGRLRLDEEMRGIIEGLRQSSQRDRFEFKSLPAVRYRDFSGEILRTNPAIVHFSGHGMGIEARGEDNPHTRKFILDEVEADRGGLVVEDEAGQVKILSSEALAGLFELFADCVECVVLNACFSHAQAQAIAQHIPFVVGMGKAIGDRAAIEFAIAFYTALGEGKEYEFAFKFARTAIDLAGIPEGKTPQLFHGKALIKPQQKPDLSRDSNKTLPNTNSGACEIWRQKLAYLQQQEAIAANPAVKFELSQQIEECQRKISELGG